MLKLPTRLMLMTLANSASACGAFLAHGALADRDAGAVHQTRQAAHRGGGGHHGLGVGLGSDIALDEAAADLLRHGLAAFDLQIGQQHLGAGRGQHARRAFAQAGRRPGDDEHLAVVDFHDVISLWDK
jgi:hypothetical protein